MPVASAADFDIRFFREVSYAAAPIPGSEKGTEVPKISAALIGGKNQIQNPTARRDRLQDDPIRVGFSANGNFNVAVQIGAYDEFWQGLFSQLFVDEVETQTDIVITPGAGNTGTITTTAGDFSNFNLGQWFRLSAMGEAGNDNFLVQISHSTAPTTTQIDYINAMDPTTRLLSNLTSQGAGNGTLTGRTLTLGTTVISQRIEFENVKFANNFRDALGVRMGQFSTTMAPQQAVTGQFDFLAQQRFINAITRMDGAPNAAPSNPVMDTSVSVAGIMREDAFLSEPVQSLGLTINANISAILGIGTQANADILDEPFTVGGPISIADQGDTTLLTASDDHTPQSIVIPWVDPSSNAMIMSAARAFISEGDPNPTGNGAVTSDFQWAAARDPTSGVMFRFDSLVSA